jgi:serine/threonine-protein kinase
MRIALADDSLLIRQGLVSLLAADGFEVTASVSAAGALIDAIRIDEPDVCIVDIRMPPTFTDEGIAAAAAIRSEFPLVGVLVLSHHIEPSYAMRLISDYPARTGYLLKERLTDGAILRDSLQRIADGETVIDPTIVAALMNRTHRSDPLDALTEREQTVLGLVAEGLTNQAIAERLWITERTVESHVSKIFGKLRIDDEGGAHRRVLAVLAYLRGPHDEH